MLREQLCLLIGVCADVAERERDTVMLGRTHGQAAVPITFGLKAAVWLDELRRQLIRLDEATPRCSWKFLEPLELVLPKVKTQGNYND